MSETLLRPGFENANLLLAGAGSAVLKHGKVILNYGLEMSGAEHTSVLLVPTAEPTLEWHNEFLADAHRAFSKVEVDTLHQYRKPPSQQEIADKIGHATHIWPAGGDTRFMLAYWAQYGILEQIETAVKRGVTFMGGSATALAPMIRGHSDYQEYRVPNGAPWEYEMIDCLGWIAASAAPHFDTSKAGERRSDDFIRKYLADRASPDIAFGFDEMAALAIQNGKFRVIRNPHKQNANESCCDVPDIHLIRRTEVGVQVEALPVSADYRPLNLATQAK